MDDLDHKIIQLLAENARMPVKDIAQQVNLTSPPVPADGCGWKQPGWSVPPARRSP